MHIKIVELRKSITLLLLYLFIINVVFLPNDTFQLKKVSFVLLILLNIGIFFGTKDKLQTLVFMFATMLPLYIILKSFILTGNLMNNIAGGFTGFMLLLFFIIQKYNFDFEKILMRVLIALALFMVLMALLDFTGMVPTMSNPLLMWFYATENAMVGRGAGHAFGIIYFMKASPLLLICLPYCIKNKKYIWAIIVIVALLISGTRGNVLMGIIVFLACLIYGEKKIGRRLALVALLVIAVYVALFGIGFSDIILDAFTMKSHNDSLRSLSLESIFMNWKRDPISFIIGSGYSSEFFDFGMNQMVSNVELSYWNLLRRVGIFVFFMMMYMFIYPILKTYKSEPLANIGYIGYLIVAYTNPLLYTSTGITLLLYMFYLLMRKQMALS